MPPANYRNPPEFPRATGYTTLSSASASPSTVNDQSNVVGPRHMAHGKITHMNWLLRQCGADIPHERANSIGLERERAITNDPKISLEEAQSGALHLMSSLRYAQNLVSYNTALLLQLRTLNSQHPLVVSLHCFTYAVAPNARMRYLDFSKQKQ